MVVAVEMVVEEVAEVALTVVLVTVASIAREEQHSCNNCLKHLRVQNISPFPCHLSKTNFRLFKPMPSPIQTQAVSKFTPATGPDPSCSGSVSLILTHPQNKFPFVCEVESAMWRRWEKNLFRPSIPDASPPEERARAVSPDGARGNQDSLRPSFSLVPLSPSERLTRRKNISRRKALLVLIDVTKQKLATV